MPSIIDFIVTSSFVCGLKADGSLSANRLTRVFLEGWVDGTSFPWGTAVVGFIKRNSPHSTTKHRLPRQIQARLEFIELQLQQAHFELDPAYVIRPISVGRISTAV